jgi:hypothetical protein
MKKYAFILIIILIAVCAYTSDMAASISKLWGSGFYCSYSTPENHYCAQLIGALNICAENSGRAMILFDDESDDNITSIRKYHMPFPYLLLEDYFEALPSSNIMMGHSRSDESGINKPFHPFVWESRKDSSIYTFMSDEDIEVTELEQLLTEGGGDEWLIDAIDHLHINTHNASITDIQDVSDAEYYFLWLIKNIEANRDILSGLRQALYRMNKTPGIGLGAWKNFIFSDGEALYLYKSGAISGTGGYEHRLYYGDVIRVSNNIEYDQYSFAVTTNGIGANINYTGTSYKLLEEELLDLELVVLHSDGEKDVYQDFGNPYHLYRPKVEYLMENGVNWKCFPVDYPGLYASDQIEETENFFTGLSYWDGSLQTLYYGELETADLEYTMGYKLELNSLGMGILQYDLEGVHVFEDREIPLDSEQNRFWIPYFVHGSASVFDAFEGIIGSATHIQSQYWTMWRKNTSSSWTIAIDPGKSATCHYGRMYDVTLTAGHPTVMDYYGLMGYGELEEYIPPETEYYQYQEKMEYEAILIDTIITSDPIEEIAVYEGEECIGASVFRGYPVFIRAFTTGLNRSNEPLEFRIFTGGRSEPEIDYRVYDAEFALYREEGLYPRENMITRVCLGEKGMVMPVMDDFAVHARQYPDPFNPETAIEYSIPASGMVSIAIYNIRGQRVRSLLSSEQAAGLHKVIWNGTDDGGRRAASGLYFYELRYEDQSIREKMLMIK